MLEKLPEAVSMIGSSGIFMMATANGVQHINKTRIIEAVIIAVILGAGGYFIALPALMEQVTQLKGSIVEIKEDVKEIKRDLTKVQIEQAKNSGPVQPPRRERY